MSRLGAKKQHDTKTLNAFDMLDASDQRVHYADWRPSEPPSLTNVKDIIIDFETDGLQWWNGHRLGGVAYCLPDGTTGYLPCGHKEGYNLPRETVINWLKSMRNMNITNLNTRFEVHMAMQDGVDFETQGCTVSDVAHWAALLDDHRYTFSLEALCNDYLDDEDKVKKVDGWDINPARMMEYPSGMIAVRGIADVRQVFKLKQKMWPLLTEQDLHRVRQLEDEVIYVVCEMERNGSPIDMELLERWTKEARMEYHRILFEIEREAGIKFNPDSGKNWEQLFQKLHIPITEFTDGGAPSFTDAVLKRIPHPLVQKGRRAGKLSDLDSKYLGKYLDTIGSDGILRYALHQLRSDEGGTISGRFSSSAMKCKGQKDVGANLQQVMAVAKQIKEYGESYVIRRLFKAGSGLYVSADMMQVEYRLFADMAQTPSVMEAYAKDPRMSFHEHTWALFKQFKPDLAYKQQKNINFAKIYAAGLIKLAIMLEYITERQAAALTRQYARRGGKGIDYKRLRLDPLMKDTVQIDGIYARLLPEVQPLLQRASHLAQTECNPWCRLDDALHRSGVQHRGYVKTLLGRRMRFPDNRRLHKALNGVIQGGAADVNKQKLVDVYKERKRIGLTMRITNHDELCGDAADLESARMIDEVLNRQSFPQVKVPLLWDTGVGPNWADQTPLDKMLEVPTHG